MKSWENLTSIAICPPYLYTVTTLPWEIQKSHFSTVLFIQTSDYYVISEGTNCNCCTAAYLFTYCCLLLPVISNNTLAAAAAAGDDDDDDDAGVYLTIVMAMTSISVITAVFVLNLHYRGPNRRPVPSCLRRLLTLQPPSFTLRPSDGTERDDVSLHDNDWTLTMTVETLARELSHELDNVTVSLSPQQLSSHFILQHVFSARQMLLGRAVAKGGSVCLSVRHTREPRLRGSSYWNRFRITR